MRGKYCSKCQEVKEFSEFYKSKRTKDGLHGYCKVCDKKRRGEWYAKNKNLVLERQRLQRIEQREWFNDLKSKLKCEICEEQHPAIIDFHHRDPKEKKFSLGNHRSYTKKGILEEMRKCDILCANCHRKLHWEENNGN